MLQRSTCARNFACDSCGSLGTGNSNLAYRLANSVIASSKASPHANAAAASGHIFPASRSSTHCCCSGMVLLIWWRMLTPFASFGYASSSHFSKFSGVGSIGLEEVLYALANSFRDRFNFGFLPQRKRGPDLTQLFY